MKILSLFWHSVEPDSIIPEYLDRSNPSASMFRDQIVYIINKYTPISIYEFMKIMKNANLIRHYKKPPVLLGFDDGFKNVITQALPILNEFKVPAIFFVLGNILKNPDLIPWDIEMKHLLRRTRKKTIDYCNKRFNLDSKQNNIFARHLFVRSFYTCKSESDRQRLLNDFANALGVDRPTNSQDLNDDYRFVSKEELSNLDSTSLLTVASHTMTHSNLARLTYEEQKYELKKSHLLLSEHCPSYYPTVAYPLGYFNSDTINIVKQIYKSAFAVFLGSTYKHIYAYPRICIGNHTIEDLTYALSPIRRNILFPIKQFLHNIGLRRID